MSFSSVYLFSCISFVLSFWEFHKLLFWNFYGFMFKDFQILKKFDGGNEQEELKQNNLPYLKSSKSFWAFNKFIIA